MTVASGTHAAIFVTTPGGLSFTNQATTASQGYTRYTIASPTRRFWTAAAITVEVDTGGGYAPVVPDTIRRNAGYVEFTVPYASTDLVRISGTYLVTAEAGTGKDWELNIEHEDLDASAFGDDWRVFASGIGQASVKFGSWYVDDFYLNDIDEAALVVTLFTNDETNTYWTATCRLDTASVKTAEGALIEHNVDLHLDGPPVLTYA